MPRTVKDALSDLYAQGATFLPAVEADEALTAAGYGILKGDSLAGWAEGDAALGVNLVLGQVDADMEAEWRPCVWWGPGPPSAR